MSKSPEYIFGVALKRFAGASARRPTLIEEKIPDVYCNAGVGAQAVVAGAARHTRKRRLTKRSAASGITASVRRTTRVGRPTILLKIRQRLPLNGEARRSAGRSSAERDVD